MNALKHHWNGKWAVVFGVFSLVAALSAHAANTATVTVQVVGGGTVSPNYNGQALTAGLQYTMTAKPKSGFVFNGWSGSLESSQPKLTFVLSSDLALTASFVDTKAPTLKIMPVLKSWSTNSVSNAVYVVTGTARDNGTIANVFCKVNGGAWLPASTGNGWSNWWCNVTLTPNTNTIYAYAVDSDGNTSKTAKLKIIYSIAQPNLYYPIQGTMVLVDSGDNEVNEATFAEKNFSDLTGVGTYTYKKTGPVTGKLIMKYSAPPSAVNKTNDFNDTMLYADFSTGTFADASDLTFYLYYTYNWAPPSLTGARLEFTDTNGSDTSVLIFPNQPVLGENPSLAHAPNPLVLQLGSTYPGQIGDRVKVTFNHTRKMNGTVKTIATPTDIGTVIETNLNTVKVLFDAPSSAKTQDPFTPTGISTISYYYQNFSGGDPVTNGTGTFTYTNYTWVGSLLQLNQDGLNKYVILTFTNDAYSGIYYDEAYLPDSTYTTDSGSFTLAAPPQIISQPQTYAWTNSGTANFSVVASGTPALVYQWLFNGTNLVDGPSGSGSTISGSTTTNLMITGLTTSDLGNYQVIVTNDYGSVTSSNASLTIAASPQITSPPTDASASSGQAINLYVTAVGSQPLTYQWQANGANLSNGTTSWNSFIQGATTSNLNIINTSTNDTGLYRVIISNNFGSVTSSIVNVTVF